MGKTADAFLARPSQKIQAQATIWIVFPDNLSVSYDHEIDDPLQN